MSAPGCKPVSVCLVSGRAENKADALWRLLGHRQSLCEGTCSFWEASGITYSLLAQGGILSKNISHFLCFQTFLVQSWHLWCGSETEHGLTELLAEPTCPAPSPTNPPFSLCNSTLPEDPVPLQKCSGKEGIITSKITVADESDPRAD